MYYVLLTIFFIIISSIPYLVVHVYFIKYVIKNKKLKKALFNLTERKCNLRRLRDYYFFLCVCMVCIINNSTKRCKYAFENVHHVVVVVDTIPLHLCFISMKIGASSSPLLL